MNWFIFSLLSVFTLASAELLQQKLLNGENSFDEKTSSFLTYLVQAVLLLPLILLISPLDNFFDVFGPTTLPWFAFATVIGTVAAFFYLKSLQVENISVSTIFISFSSVVSTMLGIVFLGESLYPMKILGILLVLIAIIFLNITNVKLEKNSFYGIGAGILFGTVFTIDKFIVVETDFMIYLFWVVISVSLTSLFFAFKQIKENLKTKSIDKFKPVILSGLGYLLFNLFTYKAYSLGGEVGRVDAINNSQVFLLVTAEYFILKNTESPIKKFVSAAIAFTGVFILGTM